MPQPQDWDSYLAMLDLSNPTLAEFLRSGAGALPTAVPPAGQYITSQDYTTLYPALAQQYVGEVLQKYQSILGETPELYQAAVAAGYLTPQQAQALQTQNATTSGSLQQRFAARGGLRAMAGPYQAQRTQLLEQALSDMQTAAAKASSDAYNLASTTTGQRVTALSNAGQIGVGLTNAGVSRNNARTAAEAAAAGRDQPSLQLPAPPEAPRTRPEPSLWEKMLLGILPAAVTGAGALIGRAAAPGARTPEERAQEEERYRAERARLEEGRVTEQDRTAEERAPGYQGNDTTLNTSNPFSPRVDTREGWGGSEMTPFGGAQGNFPVAAPNYSMQDMGFADPFGDQNYSWQTPMPSQYPGGGYSYEAPQYDYGTEYQGDYGYNGGGYDYSGGGGGYSYPDYGYPDYSYPDYSTPDYSYPTYDPGGYPY